MKTGKYFYRLDSRLSSVVVAIFSAWFATLITALVMFHNERQQREEIIQKNRISMVFENEKQQILNDILLVHDRGLQLTLDSIRSYLDLDWVRLKVNEPKKTFVATRNGNLESDFFLKRPNHFFIISFEDRQYAVLEIGAPSLSAPEGKLFALLASIGSILTLLAILLFTRRFIDTEVIGPIHALINSFSDGTEARLKAFVGRSREHDQLIEHFLALSESLTSLRQKSVEQAQQAVIGNLAAQVAHDIRSPLAALDNVIGNINELPEDERIIIRSAVNRIRDIANNLLEKDHELKIDQKSTRTASSCTDEPFSVQLLSSLIDPLISEKRMQFRSKIGIEIDSHIDASSYGLFARIQPTEFKRVLSNLINNSVEAMIEKGKIDLSFVTEDNQIVIRVSDNGKGIPPEILAKLGQLGTTYGKEGGSGRGVYHARKSIESWGGNLKFDSQVGHGTTISITLPKAKAPEWFVSELVLLPQSSVVVLDDDASIHGIWQGRFDSLCAPGNEIEVYHFSTPDELTNWVRESGPQRTTLYLADFELLGHKQTGLDLIEALALGPQSVLVTSRFEERHIVEGCRRMGVRLIPKGMAGFVPISVGPKLESVDAILIDDDSLVHLTWKSAAHHFKKTIRTFSDPDQFFAVASSFTKDSPIYVDVNLGHCIKGEDVAKKAHELGFMSVYLATGYELDQFQGHRFLAGVIGKDPPFKS